MATTETKIVEIKVPLGDALNQITALTAGINQLTEATKKLDKTNADEAKQIEINKLTIKDYQNQKRQLTNEVMKEVKVSNDAIGAYQKLQNEYSKAAAKAKDLAIEHGVGSKQAVAAANSAKIMADRLKEADATVGQHQRNIGNYKDALEGLPGPMGNAIGSIKQMGSAFKLLLLNPVALFIAAIVGALALLYKAFISTDSGATAFAGVLKGLGNVLDILLDRTVSFLKLLGSIAILDWEGIKKNGTEAFDGIGKSLKDAAVAGYEFEQVMDSIADRESASLIRSARLRAEIEKLKNQSKDVQYTIQQRLAFSELAMKKEIELNGIEKGFLKERNEAELKNLASKIQVAGMTTKQKEQQLREWLKLDDRQIEQYAKNNARFRDFVDKNEAEFQALQKLKSEEYNKDAEFEQGTRRLQKEGSTFRATLLQERAAQAKANEDKITTDKKAEEEKRLQDLRDYITNQSTIINDQIREYEKALEPKEATLLDKVTADAMAVLNASITKNNAIVANDKEATDAQIANAERLKNEKIQKIFDAANVGADILQGAFDFTTALAETELQLWAEQNKGKANFDEEYAKKKAEIDHKQAVRNKIMQVVNSLINGAAAVVSLLATPPLAIAAGIAAALQTAAIIATPIPDKDATSGGGGSSKASSLPPDLTSKMASPLGSSVSAIQSTGGSNAITSGAANVAMAKANEPAIYAPRVELSLVELKTKQRQVDFIDNVSTLSS